MTGTPLHHPDSTDLSDHVGSGRWDELDGPVETERVETDRREVLPARPARRPRWRSSSAWPACSAPSPAPRAAGARLGALALVLGVVGAAMARRPRVTGGLLALVGIVTAALGLASPRSSTPT